MKNSLFKRLVIALLFTFSLLLYLFFTWSNHLAANIKLESEQKLHLDLATHLVADNPMLQEQQFAYENLSGLFHTLMMLGPNFEFYFIDLKGQVLTYSAPDGAVKRKIVDINPIIALINNTRQLPILGDNPRTLNGEVIFSAAPVEKEGQIKGYLYVVIGSQVANQLTASIKDNEQLWLHFMLLVMIICFLSVTMLVVFYWVTRPVKALASAVREVEQKGWDCDALDNWSHLETVNANNEVYQLGHSFSQLVDTLKQQMLQLKAFETQRSEILAGLSHDLRTPLSSLQGYIEVLINKRDTLSEQEQAQYLEILSRNTGQLKHLTDQLFELAYLEGGKVPVNIEPILVAELMFDIKSKLQIYAQKSDVELVVCCENESLIVDSDIAKIERILTNLVDNAIRHTPAGGSVKIMSELDAGKVRLCVRDTGAGISEKEIPYVFDARYKGASRAYNVNVSQSMRTGLGLAICKKLLTLLESDIGVKSQLEKGSDFSFLLPISNY